jgi:hypothetical protein
MRSGSRQLWKRAVGLALLVSCSGGSTAPVGETLNLELSSPTADDGAVLFTIRGGPVESIDGAGYAVYSARVDANTVRVIVIGALSSGVIARIRIPDREQAPHYSATVEQVASSDHLERDPAGYAMRLAE